MSIVFAHSYCELIYLIFVSFCFHRHLECESATEWIWLEGVSATEWIRIMIEASSAIIGLKSIHFCSSTWQKGLLGYICILKVNTLLFNIFTPRHESSQSTRLQMNIPHYPYTFSNLASEAMWFNSLYIYEIMTLWTRFEFISLEAGQSVQGFEPVIMYPNPLTEQSHYILIVSSP